VANRNGCLVPLGRKHPPPSKLYGRQGPSVCQLLEEGLRADDGRFPLEYKQKALDEARHAIL